MRKVHLVLHPDTLRGDVGPFRIALLRSRLDGADVGESSGEGVGVFELPSTFSVEEALLRGRRYVSGRLGPSVAIREEATEGGDT